MCTSFQLCDVLVCFGLTAAVPRVTSVVPLLQVISGQFLSDRNSRFFVEVELLGLPGDPKKKYRTKLSTEPNSINPQWKDEETFVFEK
eukprot:g19758.t1